VIVAGKLQKPVNKRDPYREWCDELSAEIHFDGDDLFAWFEQIWMAYAIELGWPKRLAKYKAMHDVRASLDRRGLESD
jgi:hypothetical protein